MMDATTVNVFKGRLDKLRQTRVGEVKQGFLWTLGSSGELSCSPTMQNLCIAGLQESSPEEPKVHQNPC